jgi:hypothetical protein
MFARFLRRLNRVSGSEWDYRTRTGFIFNFIWGGLSFFLQWAMAYGIKA